MVRPNGSVMGRNSSGIPVDSFITCLVLRRPRRLSRLSQRNVGTLRPAYNPRPCGAVPAGQRAGCGGGGGGGTAAGAGNGDPAAGAAAALGGFGFFGRIGLRAARGGGPAGRNSATTGLGSTVIVSGLVKSPGVRITLTGTVTGWS